MRLAIKPTAPATPITRPVIPPQMPPTLVQTSTPLPAGSDRSESAQLRIPISARTLFLTIDTVRDLRGIDSEAVLRDVDSGLFLWVWDLNSGTGEVRQLRFLAQELRDPASVAKLTPDQVIQLVLGEHRRQWTGADIARMFHLTRPVIHRLFNHGHLSGRKIDGQWTVDRDTLTRFLKARLMH